MEARQSGPASDETYVNSFQPGVLSLLAKLPVELSLIRAGHPLPIVLMNGNATDFLCTNFGIGLRDINPSAMSTNRNTCHELEYRNDTEQSASHLASESSHRPSQWSIALR